MIAIVYTFKFDLKFAIDNFTCLKHNIQGFAILAQLPLGVVQQAVGIFGIGGNFKPAFNAEYAFDVAHGYPFLSVCHGHFG